MKEKEIRIEVPAGYEIDKENSTFKRLVFKKKDEFEHFKFNGAYVDGDSTLLKLSVYSENLNPIDKNIWISEAHAKASLAMSQLSVLMASPTYNGDWVADWEDDSEKWCIRFHLNEIITSFEYGFQEFLSFKTEDARDRFLKNHRDLILEAKILL